jgi:hypothetical protein
MSNEYAFEMATSSIRFGSGLTREVGMDLAEWKIRRAMVVTGFLVQTQAPRRALQTLANRHDHAAGGTIILSYEPGRASTFETV